MSSSLYPIGAAARNRAAPLAFIPARNPQLAPLGADDYCSIFERWFAL
jgi:hypothetical protein